MQELKMESPIFSVFVPSNVGKVKLVMAVLENALFPMLLTFE